MSRLPRLNALRTFEVAARRLNFSHAADELNVTPSAVSHQIKDLEAHLGVVLFHRMHRGLSLTAAGELMLPGIRSGLAAFEQAVDGLETRFRSTALTVSVPPSVAMKWLVPRLGAFKVTYPEIDVRLSSDVELPSFRREDVDIAIHYGYGDYPGLMAERLASNFVAPMCSPLLLKGRQPLEEPSDLRHFTLLHDTGPSEADDASYDWDRWLHDHGVEGVDASLGLRFGASADVLNAAVAGAGVAIGKTALAIDDLKAGRLVCLFDSVVPEEMAYYAVYQPDALDQSKVRTFRDWLFREFAED